MAEIFALKFQNHVQIYHKDFIFFEMSLCTNKVIFATEFVIQGKNPPIYETALCTEEFQKYFF
jgi:hypothetical protein